MVVKDNQEKKTINCTEFGEQAPNASNKKLTIPVFVKIQFFMSH